jgi:hypothetical protein
MFSCSFLGPVGAQELNVPNYVDKIVIIK